MASLRFRVGFGDWSNDGHGNMEEHSIILSKADGELTHDEVSENYRMNCELLGFDLKDIWGGDSDRPGDEITEKVLEVTGVLWDTEKLSTKRHSVKVIDNLDDFGNTVSNHLWQAMSLVTHGSDILWELVYDESPFLFGNRDAVLSGNSHVGYGLFIPW